MAAKQYRVLRHIRVAGAMRKPGDVLDAADVNNAQALVDQRYLVDAADDSPHTNPGGATPDPKIAQDREVERAAGRKVGPSDDVRGGEQESIEAANPDSKKLGESKATAEEGAKLKGKLPEDFPGHAKLTDAGFTTYAKVRKELAGEDPFAEVEGVGPKTVEAMREILDDTSEEEGDEDESEPGDSTVPPAANA